MRTKKAQVRQLTKDPKYDSLLVTKLVNRSMRDGKKSVAQKQVYDALEIVAAKTKKGPVEALELAVENIAPKMEVRSRRVGGASYQVPMPVRARRGTSLAIRWMIFEANKRSNKEFHTYAEKLAAEIMDAMSEAGGAIEKKLGAHRMADANKAFSHFRW